MLYVERSKSWGAAPQTTARNVLHLNVQNLAQVTVQTARARSAALTLAVTTDNPPGTVTLAGCGRTLHFGGP
jgi:hypothetical protein